MKDTKFVIGEIVTDPGTNISGPILIVDEDQKCVGIDRGNWDSVWWVRMERAQKVLVA